MSITCSKWKLVESASDAQWNTFKMGRTCWLAMQVISGSRSSLPSRFKYERSGNAFRTPLVLLAPPLRLLWKSKLRHLNGVPRSPSQQINKHTRKGWQRGSTRAWNKSFAAVQRLNLVEEGKCSLNHAALWHVLKKYPNGIEFAWLSLPTSPLKHALTSCFL